MTAAEARVAEPGIVFARSIPAPITSDQACSLTFRLPCGILRRAVSSTGKSNLCFRREPHVASPDRWAAFQHGSMLVSRDSVGVGQRVG